MFLIMSGAYVGSELESEFGKIPPSFLPLGNRRLFQHQVALAPEGVDVFLSLPDSFEMSDIDRKWLRGNQVTILMVPEKLSLGASLVAALNISGNDLSKPLHVLYGDTLYRKLPIGNNIASTSQVKDGYTWAGISNDNINWLENISSSSGSNINKIIDGYFKFNNSRELIRCITQTEWDFIKGLNCYHQSIGLIAVESNSWFDFGHVNTYYRSKAEFTTQRAFNELKITSKWVEKSSYVDKKIGAEANWFETIPVEMKGNTPQFLGSKDVNGKISYRLEYLHLTALNELFVFSKLPNHIWKQILENCLDFIELCRGFVEVGSNSTNTLDNLFSEKTRFRLNEYCESNGVNLNQKWEFNDSKSVTLSDILQCSEKHLPKQNEKNTVLHGDFCFSNILYDFRADKVKTIDPRGMTPQGEKTIYGDTNYDLAKLSHSILGLYDWIIAGYYQVEIKGSNIRLNIANEDDHSEIQQMFIDLVKYKFGLTAQHLYAMQIQLFLSMLPLHSDDINRQNALFANTFRLYEILVGLDK